MNIARRAVDKVAHIIWDEAEPGTLRYRVGDLLCWVASEWPGLRRG